MTNWFLSFVWRLIFSLETPQSLAEFFLKRILLNRTGNTDKSNPDMLYTSVKAAFDDASGSGKMSRRVWMKWNIFSAKI